MSAVPAPVFHKPSFLVHAAACVAIVVACLIVLGVRAFRACF